MIDEYIKQLEQESDDMVGGLLKELELEAPFELHEKIMKEVEDSILDNKWKNVRKYASLAAGLLLVFIGLSYFRSIFNGNEKSGGYFEKSLSAEYQTNDNNARDSNLGLNAGRAEASTETTLEKPIISSDSGRSYIESVMLTTNKGNIINFIKQNGRMISDQVYLMGARDYGTLKSLEGYILQPLPPKETENLKAYTLDLSNPEEYILIELKEE